MVHRRSEQIQERLWLERRCGVVAIIVGIDHLVGVKKRLAMPKTLGAHSASRVNDSEVAIGRIRTIGMGLTADADMAARLSAEISVDAAHAALAMREARCCDQCGRCCRQAQYDSCRVDVIESIFHCELLAVPGVAHQPDRKRRGDRHSSAADTRILYALQLK